MPYSVVPENSSLMRLPDPLLGPDLPFPFQSIPRSFSVHVLTLGRAKTMDIAFTQSVTWNETQTHYICEQYEVDVSHLTKGKYLTFCQNGNTFEQSILAASHARLCLSPGRCQLGWRSCWARIIRMWRDNRGFLSPRWWMGSWWQRILLSGISWE